MIKKAEKQLGGDILGGTDTERNGYKGYQGMLDGSIFLPRMKVEVFHVEERFVILGCAPRSMGPPTRASRSTDNSRRKRKGSSMAPSRLVPGHRAGYGNGESSLRRSNQLPALSRY